MGVGFAVQLGRDKNYLFYLLTVIELIEILPKALFSHFIPPIKRQGRRWLPFPLLHSYAQ